VRIALVTYALQVGGVETLLMGLGRSLEHAGNEIVFVETLTKGQWSGWFEAEGFRIFRVVPRPWRSRVHHARRVAEALREFDAVILNDAAVAQAALGLLRESQVALIVLHALLRSMVRNAGGNFSQADALIAVSPHVAEGAARYGVPRERIVLIPNAVSVPLNWPKRDRTWAEQTSFIKAAFVGGLSQDQKGVLHLAGIADSARARGVQVQVDVIGEGPDREALEERIRVLGLESSFVMHGRLSNIRAQTVLSEADVLLMPSYFEGMPIVLLEAMASGVVPVASRIPGCTDFAVQDGVSGMLVPISDEAGFAARLVALCRDRNLLGTMSRSAWERARSTFSLTRLAQSYLELLRRCQGERRQAHAPRSGALDKSLLGDLPVLPVTLVRPVRKLLRLAHLMPPPVVEPLLF
jgi:glycosyltransferase involved in cell wall biosynthesis